jgi:hypothetical protein
MEKPSSSDSDIKTSEKASFWYRGIFAAVSGVIGLIFLILIHIFYDVPVVKEREIFNPISLAIVSVGLVAGFFTFQYLVTRIAASDEKIKGRVEKDDTKFHEKIAAIDGTLNVEHAYLGEMKSRLIREIEISRSRGTLNLIIGASIALTGIIFICYFSFSKPETLDTPAVIAFYLPKSVFFIAVEFLAFFFLRLYRDSINVARYYHNEVTTLESKMLGYSLAHRKSDQTDKTRDTYLWLSTNDRNANIPQGQTAWDLEKAKIDQAGDLSKEDILKIAEAVATAVAKQKAKD